MNNLNYSNNRVWIIWYSIRSICSCELYSDIRFGPIFVICSNTDFKDNLQIWTKIKYQIKEIYKYMNTAQWRVFYFSSNFWFQRASQVLLWMFIYFALVFIFLRTKYKNISIGNFEIWIKSMHTNNDARQTSRRERGCNLA